VRPLHDELSPLPELKMRKPAPRPNSFDDLVLTEFGDFVAQTAAILFAAGLTFEEIADALQPANLLPHWPIADNGERLNFVRCPACSAHIPAPDEFCFNCGVPLHERPPSG
jgi:hypothetical protein